MVNQQNLTFPIVGAWFRPPGVSILKNLPLNTPLILHADPNHPKDPNAIGVWIAKSHIPFDKIRARPEVQKAMEYNRNDEFHIGFLPAKDAELLKFDRNRTILGQFKIDPNGKPQVRMTGFRKEGPANDE